MGEHEYRGIVLALGALALSAMIFFMTQIRNTSLERSILESQRSAVVARKASMSEGIAAADESLKKRESQIQRAQKLEAEYALLLTDLMDLANIDPDARAITTKWKIQQQGQAGQTQSIPAPLPTIERKEKPAPAKGMP